MENPTKQNSYNPGKHLLVNELFELAVKNFPAHTALSFAAEELTYQSLYQKVTALSHHIINIAGNEDIIGVSTTRSADMIIAVIAIIKAGKAYLPLDPSYPEQRLQQIISDSAVQTCIAAAQEHTFFGKTGLNLISSSAYTHSAADYIQSDIVFQQNPNIYVLYTSGSTGTPKGVYMTQTAMVNLILWQHQNSEAGPGTRTLQFSPLSFDVSFQEIFCTLTTGATLVLINDDLRLDPINLLEYISRNKIDRIFMPFVALQFLSEAASGTKVFPESLREVITAGEQLKITPQVKEFFKGLHNCSLYNQYGPTECHVVSQLKLNGNPEEWPKLPNIGIPIAHTQLYILDQQKNVLPEGETGELAIAGISLASGYLNKPELTAEKFITILVNDIQTRVYLTGDLACYQSDNTIDFLGRKDDQVKIRGYRIEPGEIEVLLNHIEGIKQAVIVAREGSSGQSRLLAYLVAGNTEINTIQVRKHLEDKLPDYMIPSSFVWMQELPKTTSGKVDKKSLPLPEQKRPELTVLYTPAKTTEEKKIADSWATVLELDKVGIHDNFFELGGNSLLALKTVALLRSVHHIELPITKLYQFPTISQLINYLGAEPHFKTRKRNQPVSPSEPIAIIGMAGKFPGASTVEELWEVLKTGKETTTFFKEEELDSSIPAELKNDPQYVKARGIIEGADLFDPSFFGISPKMAELMDPQQRIFLEISRDLLEKTGYLPAVYNGLTGVFAGSGNNSYYPNNIAGNTELINQAGAFQVMTVNEKDYISSRTAYQLDLKGPAVSVFSACSTSLLAVAQAVESLRKNQCDIAIAGGASISSPVYSGHLYQEGAMLSKDGHCRSFDENATGTVFSDGAGVVLLKPLTAALADGDTIYSIIKGTGINNDGGAKGSFTAPSTDGQAAAIAMAIHDANVDPATISYVETHGTATPLGDPIEIEGLIQAFGEQPEKQYCAIGSIKSNMGHMTAAAGVAGLIKTTLALYHKTIPPSINFEKANPAIPFAESPFYVNSQLKNWDTAELRRAGISSFGVGGTNVHVVVEEHSHPAENNLDKGRLKNLFTWSAKSAESLKTYKSSLKDYISSEEEINLADVAFTLQRTRAEFSQRSFLVAGTKEELENILDQNADGQTAQLKHLPGETVFLFPGQGAQYLGMAAELYQHEPVFSNAVDECASILSAYLDKDIRTIIYAPADDQQADIDIRNTKYTQPALFVTSYALAQLWISWGIRPSILCGHSIGEYVAAQLAGILSLEDALKLIAVRGSLVSRLPAGSMLSVRAPVTLISEFLPADLSVAAVNSPKLCVIAGNNEAIDQFQLLLDEKLILHKRLLTSHAFHSAMMDPVLEDFSTVVKQVKLNRPQKPVVSTVTGQFLTDAEAQNPVYWTEHLRKTVQFSAALDTILALDNPVLIETGPGNTSTTLAWQHESKTPFTAIASLEKKEVAGSYDAILKALGKVWLAGLNPDWKLFYADQQRRKITLPTYSYDKKRYWVSPKITVAANQQVEQNTNHPPIETFAIMRRDTLIEKIKHLLEEASGIEMDGVTPEMSFIEIGLDSLLLTQVAIILKKEFAIPLTFRQLNEEYSTINTLATFIDQSLPAEKTPFSTAPAIQPAQVYQHQSSGVNDHTAIGLISQQLQLLAKQVELLTNGTAYPQTSNTPVISKTSTNVSADAVSPDFELSADELIEIKKPFGATARIEKNASALKPAQKEFLKELTLRYNKKTAGSKAYTQQHRAYMADPRVVSGFKPYTKEIVYSIVTNKSLGSHLWDVDGNEYIDALNGFGSNLLGYQHPVLKAAVLDQVEKGYEIGPQHELAGAVSKLICEFTGFDRAALCNTGSEAVLGALRIARTVTGRSLIIAFSGSYHGINDEVIIRGTKKLKSFPAAPGIMPEAVENMLILDYGTEESLQIIRERAHEAAAVLVEPVQSRRPEFQPVEFLKALREITLQTETVLIFDEVITGFRTHQGGAQAMFGIQADLGTYGKVIGGGMPIGAIAGKKQFMDALDGGFWKYGDESFPEVGVTYFAGTFVRHPLALAAGKASLDYMKTKGPGLQQKLNDNTTFLAGLLNKTIAEFKLPLTAVHFGSLWKIKFKEEYPYSELLFTLMREKGIHIWDNFPCFLTEAHTSEEIKLIAEKFRESIIELIKVDLIPLEESCLQKRTADVQPPVPGARLGRDQLGNPAWFVTDPENPEKYLQVESNFNNDRS